VIGRAGRGRRCRALLLALALVAAAPAPGPLLVTVTEVRPTEAILWARAPRRGPVSVEIGAEGAAVRAQAPLATRPTISSSGSRSTG
jgi:hypothetical protein